MHFYFALYSASSNKHCITLEVVWLGAREWGVCWAEPSPTALLDAPGLGGVPHLLAILLDCQAAIVVQVHAAHLEVIRPVGASVPDGFVVTFVHDKVAVVLHAEAIGITLASCVRWPHWPPAIDHKVTILLHHDKREKRFFFLNWLKCNKCIGNQRAGLSTWKTAL